MTILPVYAALLALLFVLLSIRTIRTRHSRKVALGHGDDPAMLRAMRVHANFAEYDPSPCCSSISSKPATRPPGLSICWGAPCCLAASAMHLA
ncbi:MAPEG family protein [Aeromonas veronii]|uniref:MAPEG family protein n=1 Tax=Aeromonas veronii TaxID=654 RepID=UPI0030059AEF